MYSANPWNNMQIVWKKEGGGMKPIADWVNW